MNQSLKLIAPLAAALAIAACNAGGTSSVPATNIGQSSAAKSVGSPACPQITGQPACLVLIQSKSGISPDVAGWAPTDFQTRYHLPSSTNGSGQVVAIVDAYDNPNVASDLAVYRSQFGLGTAPFNKYNQNGQQSGYPGGSHHWGVGV
ncbi:MAG TPA: hypothetical protein VHT92_03685, partial [Candidatus Cybelea sp.]|nr:hypothetical protein [Candidatus Cybelea sp.]